MYELSHFLPCSQLTGPKVLTDLKLNPETVECKVPRYFLDDKECREEIEDIDREGINSKGDIIDDYIYLYVYIYIQYIISYPV